MGKVSALVHAVDGRVGSGDQTERISSTRVLGRFPYCSFASRNGVNEAGLHYGQRCHRGYPEATRIDTAPGQGRMDRSHEVIAPRSRHRQSGHEIYGIPSQGAQSAGTSQTASATGAPRKKMGPEGAYRTFLWSLRLSLLGAALGTLLYKVTILRHGCQPASGQSWPLPSQSPEYEGSQVLKEDDRCRDGGPSNSFPFVRSRDALGRSRCRVWRDFEFQGYESRSAWSAAAAGGMELEGPRLFNHVPRTQGNQNDVDGEARKGCTSIRITRPSPTRRQPGSRSHYELFCFVKPKYDARAAEVETSIRCARNTGSVGVAAIRSKPVRRCSIASIFALRETHLELTDSPGLQVIISILYKPGCMGYDCRHGSWK